MASGGARVSRRAEILPSWERVQFHSPRGGIILVRRVLVWCVQGGGGSCFFGCMCKSGWARSNRPFFFLAGILVAVVWTLSPQLSFMLSPPCWFLIVRWRRVCGGQLVSGECGRRLVPVCVLSEALNVASQWCGVGPVSGRRTWSIPLAPLCCAHVCTAMRKSPVGVMGDYKAPGSGAIR